MVLPEGLNSMKNPNDSIRNRTLTSHEYLSKFTVSYLMQYSLLCYDSIEKNWQNSSRTKLTMPIRSIGYMLKINKIIRHQTLHTRRTARKCNDMWTLVQWLRVLCGIPHYIWLYLCRHVIAFPCCSSCMQGLTPDYFTDPQHAAYVYDWERKLCSTDTVFFPPDYYVLLNSSCVDGCFTRKHTFDVKPFPLKILPFMRHLKKKRHSRIVRSNS